MESQQIISLEQVPAGINRLFKEIAELRNILRDSSTSQTPTITPDGELLTRQQVADRLKVSLPTLNELTKNGKIKAYRIGNRVRYKDAEVNQVLTQVKSGGKL